MAPIRKVRYHHPLEGYLCFVAKQIWNNLSRKTNPLHVDFCLSQVRNKKNMIVLALVVLHLQIFQWDEICLDLTWVHFCTTKLLLSLSFFFYFLKPSIDAFLTSSNDQVCWAYLVNLIMKHSLHQSGMLSKTHPKLLHCPLCSGGHLGLKYIPKV